jgi:hypothetical protein
MKKYYLSPEIATMDVQLTSVLCGSGPDNDNADKDSGNSFGARRRGMKAY